MGINLNKCENKWIFTILKRNDNGNTWRVVREYLRGDDMGAYGAHQLGVVTKKPDDVCIARSTKWSWPTSSDSHDARQDEDEIRMRLHCANSFFRDTSYNRFTSLVYNYSRVLIYSYNNISKCTKCI
jgi:hypothetical protein